MPAIGAAVPPAWTVGWTLAEPARLLLGAALPLTPAPPLLAADGAPPLSVWRVLVALLAPATPLPGVALGATA
jgi:hypothetical protein